MNKPLKHLERRLLRRDAPEREPLGNSAANNAYRLLHRSAEPLPVSEHPDFAPDELKRLSQETVICDVSQRTLH